MSILGIDYGSRKVGIAKADRRAGVAVPITILESNSEPELISQLRTICKSENIDLIVLGYPRSLQAANTQNAQRTAVEKFAELLRTELQLPVELVDERLTSQQAGKLLAGSGADDDDVAAMLVLQAYLDRSTKF